MREHPDESNPHRGLVRTAKTTVLRDGLRRRLAAYAVSAGSAAAGLVLGPLHASAQIVYTPAHKTITCGLESCSQTIFIDLNHDGVLDFQLSVSYSAAQHWDNMRARGNPAEQADIGQNYYGSAIVFAAGARIGRAGEYFRTKAFMAVNCRSASSRCATAWENQAGKFLGLKFHLADGVHWGWAEVTTRTSTNSITVHLEGYAYDTIAGEKISAGQLNEEGASKPAPGTGSLGVLALGAPGLELWRSRGVSDGDQGAALE
jgi:hypothetical protein